MLIKELTSLVPVTHSNLLPPVQNLLYVVVEHYRNFSSFRLDIHLSDWPGLEALSVGV